MYLKMLLRQKFHETLLHVTYTDLEMNMPYNIVILQSLQKLLFTVCETLSR